MRMRKYKTLVVVEDEQSVQREFNYYSTLLGEKVLRAFNRRDSAHIETECEEVQIVIKSYSCRGRRCNKLVYLCDMDEIYHEVFSHIVREYRPNY